MCPKDLLRKTLHKGSKKKGKGKKQPWRNCSAKRELRGTSVAEKVRGGPEERGAKTKSLSVNHNKGKKESSHRGGGGKNIVKQRIGGEYSLRERPDQGGNGSKHTLYGGVVNKRNKRQKWTPLGYVEGGKPPGK